MKKLFTLTLILIVCAGILGSTDYYVKNGGSNGNTGLSDAQAWATLTYAMSQLNGNESDNFLYLKRGSVWREQMEFVGGYGTSGHPFTIGAYDTGAYPKIMGSDQVSTWSDQGGNIWRASCASYPGGGDNNGPVLFINTNGDGKTHWGVRDTTPDAEYDWYWSSNYLYCYSPADPDTRYGSVEAANRMDGIRTRWDSHYLYIRDIEVAYTTREGIYGESGVDGGTVDGCYVHHSGPYDDQAGTQWAADNIYWEGNNWTVKNNICSDAAAHNIQHYGSECDSTWDYIEYNICYNGGHAQVDTKHNGPSGTMQNQIIRYNIIYTDADYPWPNRTDNAAISILSDMGYYLDNTQIYGNIILNFWKHGIYLDYYVDGCTIYNNVIYGRNPLCTDTADYPSAIGAYTWNGPQRYITIKNNIIAGDMHDCAAGLVSWTTGGLGKFTDIDYNCYYMTNAPYIMVDAGNSDTTYSSAQWAAWKTASGFDENSKWNINPLFVNAGGANAVDYKITSGSPCKDMGVDVSISTDFWGTAIPQGVAPDIGVHEYADSPTAHVIKLAPGTVIRLGAGTTVRIKN